MSPRHRVSRAAIELIKRFEGYRQTAAQLPDGRWMIGHGHTLTARQGAQVSEADAEALLLYDLIAVGQALDETVFTPLTQNQFDALSAFVFNIGQEGFRQSGVLKRLNEGDLIRAACAMELWRKAEVGGERIVIDALVRRRAAEKVLFLTPPDGAWVPAPTPVLPPLLDAEAREQAPSQTPVEVTTVLDGEQIVVLREGELAPAPVPPDPAEEAQSPARAAAEAVAARLATIFQEPTEAGPAEPEPSEPGPSEPEPPESEPSEPGPTAEGEPEAVVEPAAVPPEEPPASEAPATTFEDPVPFFLRAPEPEPAAAAAEPPWAARIEFEDEAAKPDLFGGGADSLADSHANDAVIEADAAQPQDAIDHGRRRLEEAAPFNPYPAPMVRPLPERPQGGVLTLVALAVLGLVFFGGGIFWATYARPATTGAQFIGPRLVGGLAGVAGVGFFVVAVYLLLDRLGRAAERDEL